MTPTFAIIAIVTIAAAVAAMSLRQLVHCALALTVALAGLALAYLQLNAQFVGFAQVLVYVGAVAVLIVFAILLTRGGDPAPAVSVFSTSWIAGAVVVAGVLSVLAWAIKRSVLNKPDVPPAHDVAVAQIGEALMTKFVLPLQVIGLLLTAALIGAVIIAMRDDKQESK
jgi:NADH:ubiquinone oxidoreductase subunit 6 (subunit J)